jgi:hypothetical protein
MKRMALIIGTFLAVALVAACGSVGLGVGIGIPIGSRGGVGVSVGGSVPLPSKPAEPPASSPSP